MMCRLRIRCPWSRRTNFTTPFQFHMRDTNEDDKEEEENK